MTLIPFQGKYNPFTEYRQEGNKIFDSRYGTLLGTVNSQGGGFIPSGYEGKSVEQVVNEGNGGRRDYQSQVMAFRMAKRNKDEGLLRQEAREARLGGQRKAIQRANNQAFQNTSFKDTNPSSADRLFNLQNFQKARPGVNFSQGDTAFGKTAGMNPSLMGNNSLY
mgnify:CR=1 FL=1|tara:strand:+ start:1361 stop:1855 length:495 start_codon:yes stop_codon:yes gene_type:complete